MMNNLMSKYKNNKTQQIFLMFLILLNYYLCLSDLQMKFLESKNQKMIIKKKEMKRIKKMFILLIKNKVYLLTIKFLKN